ncbi:YebC/PmpR family DNA-binding transcriptional regulator [Suicoccus acidiformans]|uniref:Probable transcriptional regulatory protein CL176_08440 n=1 Tax=Suicoccus acidiformans TaxID=2036206 RepID=A0A347WLR8_9LACT|nr:YebC/PmpR family DNA-binding transcriptional regulator [Suicoccus acidiformans]AXY26025.1 YebC/PmpR family DNA-binding transcriptional regulator [Suicoccus acidiformans]
MAGHSKWNNIKNRKGAQDAKRGKLFQKLSREIYMAAKAGDVDPDMNPTLRLAVDKAKAANMPNDNINRAIKRASEAGAGENYDEVVYEGYGPAGVGILVYGLTDNHNRTSTNVRTAFNHNHGNLGERGSVSFQFERKGYIAIDRSQVEVDEDTMLMRVLEAGGEDLEVSDEAFEITTEPEQLAKVRDDLQQDYTLAQVELTMLPNVTIDLPEAEVEKFEQLIEALEDDDDVTEVIHNAEY